MKSIIIIANKRFLFLFFFWKPAPADPVETIYSDCFSDFYSGPLLVIPDDPVKKGTFVSLSCNLRIKKNFPSVAFYHNNKLIQNDSREELNFLAVSKSDEGSYKCQYSGKESPSRYMSVKCE